MAGRQQQGQGQPAASSQARAAVAHTGGAGGLSCCSLSPALCKPQAAEIAPAYAVAEATSRATEMISVFASLLCCVSVSWLIPTAAEEHVSMWMHEGVHARVYPPAGATPFVGRLVNGIDSDGEVRLHLPDGSMTDYFRVMTVPKGQADHKQLSK
jgi:hypothetical protein